MRDVDAPIGREALKIFRGLSGSYDKVLDFATMTQDRRWKDWAVRESGASAGLDVLDVGCGTCLLEERLPRGCRVVGVDLTEEMLRQAQRRKRPGGGFLLLADGESLPFRDTSFDCIISCYAVKYCDPDTLVSEFARVLRPGGRLAVYDFVMPKGHLWPLNALYVHGALPLAGRVLKLAHAEQSYTFSELPKIIRTRRWDEGFPRLLEEQGFSSTSGTLMSGGVAMGFAATLGG
jgi:demethylmenaquinone methyltransferase / 2-methoxy-6-polyprenyl-1,4-benzoquinol methylase